MGASFSAASQPGPPTAVDISAGGRHHALLAPRFFSYDVFAFAGGESSSRVYPGDALLGEGSGGSVGHGATLPTRSCWRESGEVPWGLGARLRPFNGGPLEWFTPF